MAFNMKIFEELISRVEALSMDEIMRRGEALGKYHSLLNELRVFNKNSLIVKRVMPTEEKQKEFMECDIDRIPDVYIEEDLTLLNLLKKYVPEKILLNDAHDYEYDAPNIKWKEWIKKDLW